MDTGMGIGQHITYFQYEKSYVCIMNVIKISTWCLWILNPEAYDNIIRDKLWKILTNLG